MSFLKRHPAADPSTRPTREMPAITRARLLRMAEEEPECFTRPTVPEMPALPLVHDEEPLYIQEEWIIND